MDNQQVPERLPERRGPARAAAATGPVGAAAAVVWLAVAVGAAGAVDAVVGAAGGQAGVQRTPAHAQGPHGRVLLQGKTSTSVVVLFICCEMGFTQPSEPPHLLA